MEQIQQLKAGIKIYELFKDDAKESLMKFLLAMLHNDEMEVLLKFMACKPSALVAFSLAVVLELLEKNKIILVEKDE